MRDFTFVRPVRHAISRRWRSGQRPYAHLVERALLFGTIDAVPYAAHQGWVSLWVDGKTDWSEVRALLREAYRQVAPKRVLKALEAED